MAGIGVACSGRLAFCSIVVGVCSIFAFVGIAGEPLRSDWAVGRPLAITLRSAAGDLDAQRLIESIAESHLPPLVRPLTALNAAQQAEPPSQSLRHAFQLQGVDGWRAAGQPDGRAGGNSGAEQPKITPADSDLTPGTENGTVPKTHVDFRVLATQRAGSPRSGPHVPATPPKPPDISIPLGADSQADASPAQTTDQSSEATTAEAEPAPLAAALPESKPLPPLTRQLVHVRGRVRSVLNGYYRKTLNSRDHNPWEVMHGMLAYGVQSRVRQGGPRGGPITAVGWLCYNKPCKRQTLMHVTREGDLRAKYGVGLQGHLGQLLAMLAQCYVSPEYPIRVGNYHFTIQDLIEAEKQTCYSNSELTFKLIAFQYYLDLNEKWVNERGEEWDFPRLLRDELAQPIRGAACGGTHRLAGLSLAVKRRLQRGEPLDGEYARAAEFVAKYHQYAFRLQNKDGSLSTAWFQGRGDDGDIDRRIKTTGHILEWLCYSLSDEELRDQRTIRAVSYLANLMYSNYNREWEVGPVSHATHALLLYDERVFRPYDSPEYAVSYRPTPPGANEEQSGSRRR